MMATYVILTRYIQKSAAISVQIFPVFEGGPESSGGVVIMDVEACLHPVGQEPQFFW
jgi:hypothetical protein